eukprot:9667206-Lingulodinium_polyedra.AAC.1
MAGSLPAVAAAAAGRRSAATFSRLARNPRRASAGACGAGVGRLPDAGAQEAARPPRALHVRRRLAAAARPA